MTTTFVLFLLLNIIRTEPDLKYSPALHKIAQTRCHALQNWSHDGFSDLIEPVRKAGFRHLGENLSTGFSDPYSMIVTLEQSPTHYANNHGPYTHIGIAECKNPLINKGTTTVFIFGLIN